MMVSEVTREGHPEHVGGSGPEQDYLHAMEYYLGWRAYQDSEYDS